MKSNYLTLPEVSRVLDVSPSIVASWLADGSLRLQRPTAHGAERVAELSLVHLLLHKGMAVPGALSPSVRLLIVDDEPTMLRSTARLLRRRAPHLDVLLASGAQSGWRAIIGTRPDAVLLDMHMPELSGMELCEQIKRHPPTADTVVVAFSGSRDLALENAFKGAGAVALLDKPPDVRQLLRVLELEDGVESAS